MSYADEAIKAVYAFHEAFGNVDVAGMADACNFPHIRLAQGAFTTIETHEEFIERSKDLKQRLESEGWARTETKSVDVIHEGPDKVHFAIVNERQHPDGTAYKPFNTFWIVTLQDGKWGIQFRSSYLT